MSPKISHHLLLCATPEKQSCCEIIQGKNTWEKLKVILKELKLEDGSFYPLPIYMPLRDPNLSVQVLGERVDLIYENRF